MKDDIVGGREVSGDFCFGLTEQGAMDVGVWYSASVIEGKVAKLQSTYGPPPVLRSTVELVGGGESDDVSRVLLRLAATRGTWQMIQGGGLVLALDQHLVTADGDEAIFIRYMNDVLNLVEAAAPFLLSVADQG